eukprot:357329-Chlamydomonas_euryale.AAC.15
MEPKLIRCDERPYRKTAKMTCSCHRGLSTACTKLPGFERATSAATAFGSHPTPAALKRGVSKARLRRGKGARAKTRRSFLIRTRPPVFYHRDSCSCAQIRSPRPRSKPLRPSLPSQRKFRVRNILGKLLYSGAKAEATRKTEGGVTDAVGVTGGGGAAIKWGALARSNALASVASSRREWADRRRRRA